MTDYSLQPFDPDCEAHRDAVVAAWNAACGPDLVISARFVRYNVRPNAGGVNAGRLAVQDGQAVAFVLVSALPEASAGMDPGLGWIDAIAVVPPAQGQGIGTALLTWAEAWLAGQGCQAARLGAGIHIFVPGIPDSLSTRPYFEKCGYSGGSSWDVARDLRDYRPPSTARRQIDGVVRPAQPGQEAALRDFLAREFPGHWQYECGEFLRGGGRVSDFMLLWTERGVDGFCQLTFEDSFRTMERYYPYRLPRPWGQLGPIGVSADSRGEGYGAALLDAGLRRLRDSGVNGCVIDWTGLLDFYGKFGFKPYREYAMLGKALGEAGQ